MMMRKLALMMMAVCVWHTMQAIVAHPQPQTLTQPDGTTVTLRLLGDEFNHHYETTDGYTVVTDQAGRWVYAQPGEQGVSASSVMAHDSGSRSWNERTMLRDLPRHLTDAARHAEGNVRRRVRDRGMLQAPVIDYAKFRGLIILINYEDRKFRRDDVHDFYDAMVNREHYTGYTDDDGQWVECTGSVRDYYRDNSNGIFCPEFDVVGPVAVPYSCRYPQSTFHADDIFTAALDSVDGQVDFSRYDADGDGVVDMVFFLVAGYSANFTGNDDSYLWPHMYYLDEPMRDGMRFSRYACSTELYGWEARGTTIPMGISVICHEFTHVMGFPDLYDVDGAGSGGDSHHPGDWDVMASGTFFNYGRTPVSYSIFERYAFGFARPTVIGDTGHYELPYLGTSNQGYILPTKQEGEFFMMENRQPTGWDAYLPGHGMIVARVDSTNAAVWRNHRVNANPAHNYYQLLRAGGSVAGTDPSDPFPGTKQVTRITNRTPANLMTWAKIPHDLAIEGITEDERGVVNFDVVRGDSLAQRVEDFETMPTATDINLKGVQGRFARWDFIRAQVVEAGEHGNGTRAVALSCPGAVTTSEPMSEAPFMVSCVVNNPTSARAKVELTCSVNEKQTWRNVSPASFSIDARSTQTVRFTVYGIDTPAYYRVCQTGGSGTESIFIDDITFTYIKERAGLVGDVTGDGVVDVADVNAVINAMLGKATSDELLLKSDVTGDGVVDVADVNAVINAMLGK